MNEESEIQPFFGNTFHAEDKDRGLFGIELADKVQCDRQYIYDTGIIAEGTLLLPYSGVNIDDIVNNIITASKLSPSSPRNKYLIATLRGVGGGKTRMIEETGAPVSQLVANCYHLQSYIAMMVAVYKIPIIDAYTRMDAALNLSESIHGRVQKVNPSIDNMVLFIDEPVKLIENKMFPKDACLFLEQRTDRTIQPVILASKLFVDHIVDNMWIPFFYTSSPLLDATDRSMLKWLAASVSAAPRLVELMGTSLLR
eukprot:gene33328-43090_t